MKTITDRFWARVDQSGECWIWTGGLLRNGYGQSAPGKLAHRAAYELAVGPIPDGLEIDHLCRVRDCVNPAHLEPVTRAENARRRSLAQTHCKHGHEFTPANTYVYDGRRSCRTCDAMRTRMAPGPVVHRGTGPWTHCSRGHELTPDNTYVRTSPTTGKTNRFCRRCAAIRSAAYRARLHAKDGL